MKSMPASLAPAATARHQQWIQKCSSEILGKGRKERTRDATSHCERFWETRQGRNVSLPRWAKHLKFGGGGDDGGRSNRNISVCWCWAVSLPCSCLFILFRLFIHVYKHTYIYIYTFPLCAGSHFACEISVIPIPSSCLPQQGIK